MFILLMVGGGLTVYLNILFSTPVRILNCGIRLQVVLSKSEQCKKSCVVYLNTTASFEFCSDTIIHFTAPPFIVLLLEWTQWSRGTKMLKMFLRRKRCSGIVSHNFVSQVTISAPVLCFDDHGVNPTEPKLLIQRKPYGTSLKVRRQFLLHASI
jgi:hypothetical protein